MATGIMFLVMFGLMFLGVPIAVSIYIAMLVLIGMNPVTTTNFIAQTLYGGVASFTNLALPFFMICGTIMETGGLSKRLVKFANSLVGGITGSLGMVTVIACMFFGAVSGSAPATVAAIGSIMIPMMVSNGYNKYYATGLTCCAGGLGVIVPPSYPMVLYGVTCNVSVGKLFIAGLGPAFVVGGLLMLINYVMCKRWGIKGDTKLELKNIASSFWDAKWALIMPVIILGGIYSGLLTATESAAVACVWAFIAGVFIYKEIKIADLIPILMKSAKSAAMILFIIAASTAFSWVFTFSGASAALVQLVVSMNLNKTLFCLVVAIILLIFGTFMEGTAIAVLLVPVLWPIAESMGINVIHFGMILCISNVIGTMTPPVAVNIFSAVQVTRSVRELKIGEISKAEIPFFIGYVAVFFLCVFSETFCTFLIR